MCWRNRVRMLRGETITAVPKTSEAEPSSSARLSERAVSGERAKRMAADVALCCRVTAELGRELSAPLRAEARELLLW